MKLPSTKTLYRKEWHENWQSVVWPPVLTAVIVTCLAFYDSSVPPNRHNDLIDYSGVEDLLVLFWSMSAVLCGSSLIAPEKGNGTLQLLRALPLSKGQIWRGKVLVGVVTLALSVVAMTVVFMVFYEAAYMAHAFTEPLPNPAQQFFVADRVFSLALIPLFALGLAMSVYFDRVITAVIATVIAAAILVASIIVGEHNLPDNIDHSHFVWLMYGIIAVISLTVSAMKFCYGERIRGSRRLRKVLIFCADLLLIFAAFVVAILWLVW